MSQVPVLLFTAVVLGLPPPDPQLPWKLDRNYKYVWTRDKRIVGQSLLQFSKVEGTQETLYRLSSHRRYEEKGNSLSAQGKFTFRADGTPVDYREECRLSSIVPRQVGVQEVRVSFSGEKAAVTYVNNHREKNANRFELDVPPGTYLFTTHALEQWTALALSLGGTPKKTFDLLFPDHRRVLRIEFLLEAKDERLRVGTREIKAGRYGFNCKDTRYRGKVWVDAKGRLLRYESESLSMALVAVDD